MKKPISFLNKLSGGQSGKPDPKRRQLLSDISFGAGCAGLIGATGMGIINTAEGKAPDLIRPPGALPESDFLNACVRCGLCVRDCPYDTLRLATLADKARSGTPVFEARKVPCEMCDDIPCVVACPTGALDHDLTDINDAKMGLAVLIDQETCIAFQGLRCEVCFNVCPVQGEAITIEQQHNSRTSKHARFIPVVHSDACTGCGKCEYACILTNEPAIKVLPIDQAKGDAGSHYRLGWEEKQKQGSLQTVPEHEYNLPDGYEYDYKNQGLIEPGAKRQPQPQSPPSQNATQPAKTTQKAARRQSTPAVKSPNKAEQNNSPFANSALDTLKQGSLLNNEEAD